MRLAEDVKRLIVAAAIASTMGLALLSTVPHTQADRVACDTHSGAIQIAEKGSDGQETHG
ncbi:MAG: hypothetical protein GX446_17780 [Chthonomonadales bacterium]|nr:hypothetical protein [Chthonomonadales bacterium]